MGENPTTEVEIDGETVIVKKYQYGYVAVEKEPTEKEQFIDYLNDHDQVVGWDEYQDAELAETVINVHYKNADRTGYSTYRENTLDLSGFENCNVLYLEKNATEVGADTFVQVDVSDAE